MDLREYMTPSRLSKAKELILAGQLGWEPWIFSDALFTGCGYHLLGGGEDSGFLCWTEPEAQQARAGSMYLRKVLTPPARVADFVRDNKRLAASYACFADSIYQEMGGLDGLRVLETCAKGGYMAFLLRLRGAAECVCRNYKDHDAGTAFLSEVLQAPVICEPVAQGQRHHLFGAGEVFDIVVAADAVRLSHNPLDYLTFLAGMCSGGLFLWVDVLPGSSRMVSFGRDSVYGTNDAPFPFSLGGGTALSRDLLWDALRQLGFTRIQEWDAGPDGMPATLMRRRPAVWATR